MLVDDDLACNAFHSLAVKQSGLCEQVRTATNGRKALDYIKNTITDQGAHPRPNLIYLDINMPGMNGFEFLEEYKHLAEDIKSGIVVIMLTTSFNPDDKEKALSYKEVSEFRNKPLTAELLKETVERYF